MTEKVWHYLDVSSGRYLCHEHGGFCDQSDGHLGHCPLCDGENPHKHSINHVQRMLRLINGLQDRSKRSFTLAVSAFGGLGLFKVLGELDSATRFSFTRLLSGASPTPGVNCVQLAAFVFLLLTIILFSMSMRQVPVAEKGSIPKKSHDDWTAYLERKLANMEWFHSAASGVFAVSIATYAASLVYSWLSTGQ